MPDASTKNTARAVASIKEAARATAPAQGTARTKVRAAAAKKLGQQGEDAACALLRRKGLQILDRNWRLGRLELDIVCREKTSLFDRGTLVFVEVKTRDAHGMAAPADALTPRKKNALLRAIQAWLTAHDAWESPCRIDIVTVYRTDADNLNAEHYTDALTFSQPVGGGNTAWQPW